MEVSREAVVAMFVAIGYKNAKKYDDDKLMARIRELPDNIPDEIPEEHRKLFEALVEAVNDEDDIEFEEIETVKSNGKVKKAKTKALKAKKEEAEEDELVPVTQPKAKSGKVKKGAKGAKAKKPAKSSENGKVERDKYGAGVTTQSAAINKVFSRKAKDVNTIAKESGIDNVGRVRAHVYHMIKEGHVKKTEKGYVLAE